jgi:hypothetical protein
MQIQQFALPLTHSKSFSNLTLANFADKIPSMTADIERAKPPLMTTTHRHESHVRVRYPGAIRLALRRAAD